MAAPRTTTMTVPDAGSYELDPRRSRIEFGTRHMFGLAPVRGTFGIVSGRIDVADPLTTSRVEATASVSSFDTGNPKRDDRGQDAPLVLRVVEVRQDESGSLVLRATATVDRFAHGVVAMKAMAGRRLRLSLTAHAVRLTRS